LKKRRFFMNCIIILIVKLIFLIQSYEMDTKSILSLEQRSGPKYRRLFDAIESSIRLGVLPKGARLPPVRTLAHQLKITPGTVARAYQLATDEGLLAATVGRGTYVRSRDRSLPDIPSNHVAMPASSNKLNFRNAHTPDIGQSDLINEITHEMLREKNFDFAQYFPGREMESCIAEAVDWLGAHGVKTTHDDIVLTHGAHNAVLVAMSATLQGRTPTIATTELVYPGFRQAAHINRAKMLGVASDAHGMIPDALEEACLQARPQVLLVSSNVHNPTCVHTPLERRQQIAEIAQRFDLHIIEDDVYGVMASENVPGYQELCPERTWYATSLSKSFAAGLRLGFLVCPPGEGPRGVKIMQGMSLNVSGLLVSVTEKLFATGSINDFTHRIRAENAARLEIARSLLMNYKITAQSGINFIWVEAQGMPSHSEFALQCERQGILIASGDNFTLPQSQPPNAFRLTLSGAPDYETLRAGLTKLNALAIQTDSGVLT
jgi:DNA-binding transcriptional MocR family regulator